LGLGAGALALSGVIGLGAVAGVVALAVWAPWRGATGMVAARSSEEDLAQVRESRRSALREVWRGLERYRAARGAWPGSAREFVEAEPIVEDALAAPALSRDGAYVIDFGALTAAPDGGPARVIVDDPGYRAPGAAGNDAEFEPFRVVLLATGEVVGREEARRRGARFAGE
jgi:hypothetical protein